jgi:hypothetical protein
MLDKWRGMKYNKCIKTRRKRKMKKAYEWKSPTGKSIIVVMSEGIVKRTVDLDGHKCETEEFKSWALESFKLDGVEISAMILGDYVRFHIGAQAMGTLIPESVRAEMKADYNASESHARVNKNMGAAKEYESHYNAVRKMMEG